MSDLVCSCLGISDENHSTWHTYTITFFPKEERPTLLVKNSIFEIIKGTPTLPSFMDSSKDHISIV